jgi:hypothetical protein
LPAGWVDTSCHNDTCPSYGILHADGSGWLRLFMEHPDPAQREWDEQDRFTVSEFSPEGYYVACHYSGGDFAAAVSALNLIAQKGK